MTFKWYGTVAPLLSCLLLAACGHPARVADDHANVAISAGPGDVPSNELGIAPPPGVVLPVPTAPRGPVPTPAINPKSTAAAVAVVQRFADLLEMRDFGAAHDWSGAGQASGLSKAQFVAAYAKYATIVATVGPPGDSEGGAGSIYVDVPLTLSGTLRDGTPFRLEGPMSLRRVNDVDGATPAQLRWHIFQSALKPRP